MNNIDLQENYHALVVSIFTQSTPEIAFEKLSNPRAMKRNLSITDKDVEDMKNMKEEGMTYRDIGDIYGISANAAYNRIKSFKQRTQKCV